MFATVKCYSCFWLLLLLVPALLDHACAQQYVGDKCSTPHQGPGECRLVDECPSMFIGLQSAGRPAICGFQDNTLILCCTQSKIPPSKGACAKYQGLFFNSLTLPTRQLLRKYDASGDLRNEALDFPHTAAVGFNTNSSILWGCGGTLISDGFVLTAAHCLHHYQWGDAQWVRLGYLGPSVVPAKPEFGPQVLRIIERIKHPDYDNSPFYNNIALLRLERSVTFTPFIKPACLDTQNRGAGVDAVVTGWGLTTFNKDNSQPAKFVKITVPIVAHFQCANYYNDQRQLSHGIDERTHICAGDKGIDVCQTDGGGALQIKTKAVSLYRVVGISSFGPSCTRSRPPILPGVYTRVSSYIPWIESIVWPDYSTLIDQRVIV